ncbi:2-octaprenyl-6-methoxyphenyl hydroxylase [Coxiella endosymbiont of Amblyomma nuttalli]|uniref:2-octaprenyl-6-methoxyphenyl hydroxylase n=1 Tax=Coxiella endosymbiont of Amblyomma nuttalli TaxID=2749996 RepID=UPI001BB6A28B|nr:2-octaprenyl-6-methoxyphenyl hydroxylase [Coxiella endosymbiont of Amblyomma nuttalli]QTS83612.1 2-octaprenyl-6-methoxyphenol hydroxylase [Coxiella endosymbiont of Amblyomma nuttalli]
MLFLEYGADGYFFESAWRDRMVYMQKPDIVIIGAGLVGMSLTVALQNQGIRIAVLEHHLPQATLLTQKDTRPITLSLGSHQILQTLDVWDDLADEACPISIVHVSEQGVLGAVHFRADELRVPTLGYVVPFFRLQKILYQRIVSQKDVEIISINQIQHIQCSNENVVVRYLTVHGEQELQANLLVGADGTKSTVRQSLNIPVKEENKNEIALVALLKLERSHRFTAYERFTSQGTLAILPLLDHYYCRLVWTMSKIKGDEITQWTDEKFRGVIQTIFGHFLGHIKSAIRGKKRYPLQLLLTKQQTRPHCVLIGNAAHTLYPFVAQGFNLGLRDVAVLSEMLTTARREKKSLGDAYLLQSYERWRKTDQNWIAGLARGISEWFGLQLPLINRLRGLALLTTELLFPLKKHLAKSIMGLSGRLPKLVRGLRLDDHEKAI